MKLLRDKRDCTGCCACYNACGQKAISMKADREGFIYPVIDGALCVGCGACRRACPAAVKADKPALKVLPQVYAAWNLDEAVRLESTSGGVFTALARVVLESGGYVAGARYAEDYSIEHCLVGSAEELGALRQSKYAQSTVGDVFAKIRALLEKKRPVLFCGTPCQNAGLRSYLGKDYWNLYRVDFICRGVNSPKVFQKYLTSLEEEYASDITRVWFKNKSVGWNQFGTKVVFRNGRSYFEDRYHDLFMQGYLKYNLYCRPSCHRCRYKGLTRPADITLADFWGIGDRAPGLDDNRGTSMVMLHTARGEALFNAIKADIFRDKRVTADALYSSATLMRTVRPGGNRRAFFRNIDKLDFPQLMERYGAFTLHEKAATLTGHLYHTLRAFTRRALPNRAEAEHTGQVTEEVTP